MSFKLGTRWSKRGVRKCPKCGTYNGHRAAQCKNKQCQTNLGGTCRSSTAAAGTKAKTSENCSQLVGVQLHTGLNEQSAKLYSVRNLNGNLEDRGFVEIRDCVDGADEQLELKTGICYVDCEPHTDLEGTCHHVRVAAAATEIAEALVIGRDVLQRLNATTEERELIWKYLSNNDGHEPLVQRISCDTFVVRCLGDDPHQLVPYCHVELKLPSSISCDCKRFGMIHQKIVAAALLSSSEYETVYKDIVGQLMLPGPNTLCENGIIPTNLCFMRDEASLGDCSNLENTDKFLVTVIDDSSTQANVSCGKFEVDFHEPCNGENASSSPIIELINSTENNISATEAFALCYDENLQLMDCQIELMDQFNLTDQIDFCPSDIELSDDNVVFPADEELGLAVQSTEQPTETIEKGATPSTAPKVKRQKLLEVTTKKAALRQTSKVAKEKLKKGSYNVRRLMRVLESNGVVFNRLGKAEAAAMASEVAATNGNGTLPPYDASLCNLTFTNWLESVIEQLNTVIQYEGSGRPAVQIFCIHENFFQCLRARFSVGHSLRKPDHSFVLSEGPRAGLTCQIYNFTCYKSLRNVFKTDKIALHFEKSFHRTASGGYREVDFCDEEVIIHSQASLNGKKAVPIKPFQYKTYIKMGTYRSDPSEKYYFSVEWIPRVLPQCRFGEMRIAFQYGHKENHLHVQPPTLESIGGAVSGLNQSHS